MPPAHVFEESKDGEDAIHEYQYRVVKAPQGASYLHRNQKLLMRIEEQESLKRISLAKGDDDKETEESNTVIAQGRSSTTAANKRTRSLGPQSREGLFGTKGKSAIFNQDC